MNLRKHVASRITQDRSEGSNSEKARRDYGVILPAPRAMMVRWCAFKDTFTGNFRENKVRAGQNDMKILFGRFRGNGATVIILLALDLAITSRADSQLVAWGVSSMTNVPPGLTNAVAIAAGDAHSLALMADGSVVAWGNNLFGQTNVPPGLTGVIAIEAGWHHNLALKADGTVVAWGDSEAANTPPDLTNVVAIAAGTESSLALQADGNLVVWGSRIRTNDIPADMTTVVTIASGSFHYLALAANNTTVSWGKNQSGQTNVPPGLSDVIMVAGGFFHSIALKVDGTVTSWGTTNYGLSDARPDLTNVVTISAGDDHSLALRADGTVLAWGANYANQTNVPLGLTNVIAIAGGGLYSLALVGERPPVQHAPVKNPIRTGENFSVTLPTQHGRVYRLEYVNSLTDANWAALLLSPGNGSLLTLTDPTATSVQRFYRVRQW
jgi:hypothetical protein